MTVLGHLLDPKMLAMRLIAVRFVNPCSYNYIHFCFVFILAAESLGVLFTQRELFPSRAQNSNLAGNNLL